MAIRAPDGANKHKSESDLDFELFRDSSSYHLSNQRLAYIIKGG